MPTDGPTSLEPVSPEPISAIAPAVRRPRLIRQQWRDLAFLHWAVDPATLAGFFPPGVRPDVLDGRSYVGLVAFRMCGSGLARGPSVPWVGDFLETNVRLYSVDASGRRGVMFLSLDADRALAVAGARTVFGLPYRWARMRHHAVDDVHTYRARLRWPGVAATSRMVVRAGGPLADGPLERFLTARWGLHVAHFGRTWYVPNEHPVWPLRSAELVDLRDGLVGSVGLGELSLRPPDHVMFSDGVPVIFGLPCPAGRPR